MVQRIHAGGADGPSGRAEFHLSQIAFNLVSVLFQAFPEFPYGSLSVYINAELQGYHIGCLGRHCQPSVWRKILPQDRIADPVLQLPETASPPK